jgi:hypothetical protein
MNKHEIVKAIKKIEDDCSPFKAGANIEKSIDYEKFYQRIKGLVSLLEETDKVSSFIGIF